MKLANFAFLVIGTALFIVAGVVVVDQLTHTPTPTPPSDAEASEARAVRAASDAAVITAANAEVEADFEAAWKFGHEVDTITGQHCGAGFVVWKHIDKGDTYMTVTCYGSLRTYDEAKTLAIGLANSQREAGTYKGLNQSLSNWNRTDFTLRERNGVWRWIP